MHFFGVLVCLADVVRELAHPLMNLANSSRACRARFDHVRQPARFHVIQHRERRVEHCHQGGRETTHTRFAIA